MMKQQSNLTLIIFLAVTLTFYGCSDDDGSPIDDTAPLVENIEINGKEENISVDIGGTLVFEAVFSDNVSLSEYKIDIHNNFDGHGHGRLNSAPFEFSEVYALSGNTETVEKQIEVPADATPGPYHFTLQFLDEAGNEGEIVALEFEINDPVNQPVINISSPDISEGIEVATGGSITLAGTITDPDGLEKVHIMLNHEEEHDHGKLHEEPLYDNEILLKSVTSWDFEEMDAIEIPEGAEAGHYELTITATDLEGNVKTVRMEVHVE